MFFREIEKDLKIALSVPQFASQLFALTDQNRDYLKAWLPWLDTVREVDDTKKFIELQLQKFARGEGLHLSIFNKDRIVGVLGYDRLDQINGIGIIGYWLAEECTGKGIMTKAVKELIPLGFDNWHLQKVEIHCAIDNIKSRAIPEKLGFRKEGTIRRTAKIDDKHQDHVIYGLLKEEYSVNQAFTSDREICSVIDRD